MASRRKKLQEGQQKTGDVGEGRRPQHLLSPLNLPVIQIALRRQNIGSPAGGVKLHRQGDELKHNGGGV